MHEYHESLIAHLCDGDFASAMILTDPVEESGEDAWPWKFICENELRPKPLETKKLGGFRWHLRHQTLLIRSPQTLRGEPDCAMPARHCLPQGPVLRDGERTWHESLDVAYRAAYRHLIARTRANYLMLDEMKLVWQLLKAKTVVPFIAPIQGLARATAVPVEDLIAYDLGTVDGKMQRKRADGLVQWRFARFGTTNANPRELRGRSALAVSKSGTLHTGDGGEMSQTFSPRCGTKGRYSYAVPDIPSALCVPCWASEPRSIRNAILGLDP